MRNHRLFAALAVLLLSALACARTETPEPAGADAALPAGETFRTIIHAGRERSYLLYTPAAVDWSRPVALVFVLHGGTGNARSAVRMSGFNDVADQNGFLVAYPNGTNRLGDDLLLTWNGGACCGYASDHDVDDVGFLRAAAADVQSLTPVDPKRIYATGMSNGAILSHRLACEAADLFAAVGPVAGTLNLSPCTPSQPVSVIEFHGTEDEHIPYLGGPGPKSLVDVSFNSVPASIAFWAAANRCPTPPTTETHDVIRHDAYGGCANSTAVELYTILGGGHAWPGGEAGYPDADQPTTAVSASQLIWEFFATHPKP
jgi:polyhydroxybutyrate depolymerase